METVVIEQMSRIRKLKANLEKSLKVNLTFNKDNVEIESKNDDAYNEYLAVSVLEALDLGFDLNSALSLKNENYMIEKIPIKNYVRPSRMKSVLGRVIGERGRTKQVISEMTGCAVSIKDYTISIIGDTEDVSLARHAVQSLIRGAPHSNVYAYLERNRRLKRIKEEDIDLKEFK